MSNHAAVPTESGLPSATDTEPKRVTTVTADQTPGQKRETPEQSVEMLLQLRTQIDQQLKDRLTQNLCLLLADVVGSTSFYQQHGDIKGRLYVQRHHDILSSLVKEYGGKVIKTVGDAVMASFEEPKRALDCAVIAQQKLCEAKQQEAEDTPLQTKISLHYGSALVETNDIFGDLVNMSARLNSLAEPDQILLSEEVYNHVTAHTHLPLLPLKSLRWKEGEKGLVVYEALWQQNPEMKGEMLVFRDFGGANGTCFYCGLREHPVTACPSKQLSKVVGRLDRLGYLPLPHILKLFQQEELSPKAPVDLRNAHLFDAFYEISLAYQLRFLTRVWIATSDDWRQVERQQITASPMAGTRLWMGFDCLRVGRLDDAQGLLLAALESNPDDYKPHVALGFWAIERADPFTALKYWRQALSLVNTNLQGAYLHLLMHRLYEVSGKTDLAHQELQKALHQDVYLHEAKYRRIALHVQASKNDLALSQLQKLIHDDRTVFVKVLLDPAFASLHAQLVPLLSTLLREARKQAIKQMRLVSEAFSAFRDWYQQQEAELTTVERAVEHMRQHIKGASYYGYRDVIDDGELLLERMQKLLARRQSQLRREFDTTLAGIRHVLGSLSTSGKLSHPGHSAEQLATCQKELARLQQLQSLHTASRFWRSWKDLQALKAAVEQLNPSLRQRRHRGPQGKQNRRSIVLFGLAGSSIVATTLFGVLGYLAYFSRTSLSEQKIVVFLLLGALGGGLIGSAIGWVTRWYRS